MTSSDEFVKLRDWLSEHWDPALTLREWWSLLGQTGWSTPSWPRSSFGRDLSLANAALVDSEIAAAGAVPGPGGLGMTLLGPTLFDYANDDQRARHLWPISSGAASWCQLFSEPSAGSDLASLRTKAERDGDHWVVNGQKVWTSGAEIADWGMLLAKTNLDVPKQAGISFFLVDMHQPGVDIRPLREMTGRSFFSEVFLTDVHVSADDLVGGEGSGWTVAKATLNFERALSGVLRIEKRARPGSVAGDLDRPAGDFVIQTRAGAVSEDSSRRSLVASLIRLAHEFGRYDADTRQGLAKLYALERIIEFSALRARAEKALGRTVPGAPNLAKLAQNQVLRLQRDLIFKILGSAGQLFDYDGDIAERHHDLVEIALFAQAPSIYGGSEQIQRNIVGEQVLGLPREPKEGSTAGSTRQPQEVVRPT